MNLLKKKTKLTVLLIFAAMLICSEIFGVAALPNEKNTAYAETAANVRSTIEAETTFATSVMQHETFAAAWKYANDNSSVDSAITIKLIENCNTTIGFVVDAGKNIILDLNGCTVNRGLKSATKDGYVIKVLGKFTLNDSLSGGTVTGGNNLGDGGGLHAVEASEVMILGGKVSGNYAQQGGGIYSNRGVLTMTGGTISGNKASGSGGGLYAIFTKIAVYGGEISSNSASTGAGINVGGGTLDIGGSAKISNNMASYGGGGIYCSTVELTMSGGEISLNKANGAAGGGGIYGGGVSNFNMSGGTLKGNTSTSYGGGVFFSGGKFDMSGSASITQNIANNSGGGVSLYEVTFTMSESSSITLNSAYGRTAMSGGGGLFLADNTEATLNDATISDNTASANSGGIFMSGAVTLTINGGTISTASFYAIYSLSNTGKIIINQEATIISGSDKSQMLTKTPLVFAEGLNPIKNYSLEWDGSWDKETVLVHGCNDLSKFTFILSDKSKKVVALNNNIVLDTYSVKASKVVSNNFIALYTDDLNEAILFVLSMQSATVELFKDVTVNKSMVIASGATVNLKLNGCTILGQGSSANSLFKVDGTLVLKDSAGGKISSSSGYALYANNGSIAFDGDVSLTSESGFAQIYTKKTITVSSGVTLTGSYMVEYGATNTLGVTVVSGAVTGFTLVNENFAAVAEDNNLLLYAVIAVRPTQNTSIFTYTGYEQTYNLAESECYRVEGNKRTASGSQKVTVSLSPYYTWTDGTTDDVMFDFIIDKAIVEKPTEDSSKFTYTGLNQTYQPSGFNSLFMTISGNEQTNASVSGHIVTVMLDVDNCQWKTGGTDNVTFCFIIYKTALTVTANDNSIFYGEAPSASGVTYAGFVSGEDESALLGTLGYSYNYSQYGDVGNYTITPKDLTSNNYEITFFSGTLTISAKEIVIDWCADIFTYNGLDQKASVTASYKNVNNQKIFLAITGGEFKNYSENGVSFSVSFANNETNYKLPTAVAKTYNIQKLAVSVKANDNAMTYGDSLPMLGWSYAEGSEQFITADNITLTVITDATSTSNANGTYYTRITPLVNDNYFVTYTDGTMTVSKRDLSVTIDNATSVYGSILTALTASVTRGSIVNGDTEVYTLSTNAIQTSDIGDDYAIIGTAKNANYNIIFVSATYFVTAKTLTKDMIADIASVVYNGQAQEPNVTVSDGDLLKNTDYELAFLHNTDAGTATVTITAKGNYVGDVTLMFTIQKAEFDLSEITFEDKTVVHNGTAFGIKITGELPSNVTVTYSENKTAVGIYTMTATFAATSENYIVPEAMTATLTIRYDKQEQPGEDGEGGTVIIESPEGIDPNHKLSANDVTDNYSPALDVESTIGKNQEIKQVYSVKLVDSNNVVVQPDGLLTIRLLLAENYRNLTELKVYVMDGATMTELTATRDGNYLVFSTAQLAEYAIVGEVPDDGLPIGGIVCIVLASILILLFLLLLILFLLRKDKSQGFKAYCSGLFKKDGKNANNEVSGEPSSTRAKNQKSAENEDDLKE